MSKKSKAVSEPAAKLENTEFDLFKAIEALDRKDYGYYSSLTEEQQKKFVPYLLLQWLATISGNPDLQKYYLLNTDVTANTHFLNEKITAHPELQWLMLCAISPGLGKQFHKWIPVMKKSAQTFKEPVTVKEITEYFSKLYPTASTADIKELATAYAADHKHKCWLAEKLPELKQDDIETLAQVFTPEHAKNYEADSGK